MQSQPSISKILSPNDTGHTGSHQAGILISKKLLGFFPKLLLDAENPRIKMRFTDDSGEVWAFTFIHYNNKFRGGTRNEYRLTGLTQYIKQFRLQPGDKIRLLREHGGEYFISHHKSETATYSVKDDGVIVLTGGWTTINLSKRDLC